MMTILLYDYFKRWHTWIEKYYSNTCTARKFMYLILYSLFISQLLNFVVHCLWTSTLNPSLIFITLRHEKYVGLSFPRPWRNYWTLPQNQKMQVLELILGIWDLNIRNNESNFQNSTWLTCAFKILVNMAAWVRKILYSFFKIFILMIRRMISVSYTHLTLPTILLV